jgi:hypothetical protein
VRGGDCGGGSEEGCDNSIWLYDPEDDGKSRLLILLDDSSTTATKL